MTDAVKELREYLKDGPHDTYVPYEIADEALTALEAVLEACDVADQIAEKSLSRMFDGEPFPAILDVETIRTTINKALGADGD